MKFTLTYQGQLPASANSSRKPEAKWKIRGHIHPQIAELTQTHKVLKKALGWSVPKNTPFAAVQTHHLAPEDPRFRTAATAEAQKDEKLELFAPIIRGGKKFIPIVRESMALTCALDIIFLRKEDPGALILQGGDIDGRIKTLFDALRMPCDDDEARQTGAEGIPDPMYCLLESDSLITACNITTGRLLTAPDANEKEVHLIVNVDVRVMDARMYNMLFLGD